MGTLGKALGAAGGSFAEAAPLLDLLITRRGVFIFRRRRFRWLWLPRAQAVQLVHAQEGKTPLRQTSGSGLKQINMAPALARLHFKKRVERAYSIIIGGRSRGKSFPSACEIRLCAFPRFAIPPFARGKARVCRLP